MSSALPDGNGIGGSGISEVTSGNIYNNGGQNEVVLTNTLGDEGFAVIPEPASLTLLALGGLGLLLRRRRTR